MIADSKRTKNMGYIPYNAGVDESVTITLEYAYDDWCVAQMAKALGKTEDATFFTKRSEAYTHLFDKETGFMRGKALMVNGVHLLTLNAPTTAKTLTIPKVTLGNTVGLCLTTYKDLSTYLEAMNLL